MAVLLIASSAGATIQLHNSVRRSVVTTDLDSRSSAMCMFAGWSLPPGCTIASRLSLLAAAGAEPRRRPVLAMPREASAEDAGGVEHDRIAGRMTDRGR